MTADETLRAISRLLLGGLVGKYGDCVAIDCASDEEAEELFDLLSSVSDVADTVSAVNADTR